MQYQSIDGSRFSQLGWGGGRQSQTGSSNLWFVFGQFLAENCMKMKRFGMRWTCPLPPPAPGSINGYCSIRWGNLSLEAMLFFINHIYLIWNLKCRSCTVSYMYNQYISCSGAHPCTMLPSSQILCPKIHNSFNFLICVQYKSYANKDKTQKEYSSNYLNYLNLFMTT